MRLSSERVRTWILKGSYASRIGASADTTWGLGRGVKPCEWAYFSTETLEMLKRCAGRRVGRYAIRKYCRRNGLLASKYMRKVAWRLMIQVMPREVARFIQSRFGELKVSEARYEDLLSEADEHYPRYLEQLDKTLRMDTAR